MPVNVTAELCLSASEVESHLDAARFSDVIVAIFNERKRQIAKRGLDKAQGFSGFTMIVRKELEEAEDGWMKDIEGKHSGLAEMVQVAATAIACLQRYGLTGNPTPTDDLAPVIAEPHSA